MIQGFWIKGLGVECKVLVFRGHTCGLGIISQELRV